MLKSRFVFLGGNSFRIFLLLFAFCTAQPVPAQQAPELFTYEELQTLYNEETLPQPLEAKLDQLLKTPFVNNSHQRTTAVSLSQSAELGEFLRVAHWNIERGLEYEAIEAAFTSDGRLEAMLDAEEFPPGSAERRAVLAEAAMLRAADVIVLNEVDWGMKRTDYRNVVADLAQKLGMNYAFGVQFVELSPVALSQEPVRPSADENEALEVIKVDPALYKGLHGIAVLSRYPLENVRLAPFKNQPYDWYQSEKKGASWLEKGKRELSKKIFLEKTLREVRRGGRTTLLADIVDRRFPSGRVTIVATHLENRTTPSKRVEQLKEMLDSIKEIRHPVVLAGDMNTSTEDLTPTSLRRELAKRFGNPKFWLKRGLGFLLGFGLVEDFVLSAVTFGRKHADPTVKHVPFFIPNPERKFFTTLQNFRFADGGAFDFRGDAERSVGGKNKRLSNSNERTGKGFVTTFQLKRPIKFIGKYKLDWIFVKPASLTNPSARDESYRFAPHFGRTLKGIGEIIEDRISDHRPMLVDLPLAEPPIGRSNSVEAKNSKEKRKSGKAIED